MVVDQRVWFQKDGVDLTDGIEAKLRFKSAGGLEIYNVTYNGSQKFTLVQPQYLKDGYTFRIEEISPDAASITIT